MNSVYAQTGVEPLFQSRANATDHVLKFCGITEVVVCLFVRVRLLEVVVVVVDHEGMGVIFIDWSHLINMILSVIVIEIIIRALGWECGWRTVNRPGFVERPPVDFVFRRFFLLL